MELRVWIGSVQRIISGVSPATTSHEVIVALAQATGKTGRFTLVEKWRDYEKTLNPNECPLAVAQKFGDYAHEVQFILRQTGEASTQSSRLAGAKSPKPQRRRAAIKKSMSFSGGAQTSVSSSRSPRLVATDGGIAEEPSSDQNYGIPQPRKMVPQPHPADKTVQSMRASSGENTDSGFVELSSLDHLPPIEAKERRARRSSGNSPSQSNHRQERSKKHRSRERLTDKREAQSRSEAEKQAESRLTESYELQKTIANHERRLEEEKRKLNNIDKDISAVTIEEERKWGELYDCRDDIGKALTNVQALEIELDDFDEVLLSEENNVLLRKQVEMAEEMSDLRLTVEECDNDISKGRKQSELLAEQLADINAENESLDSAINSNEDEVTKLLKWVEEKKRFLLEAEDGYTSACDDLKEAENSLDKRKQMLVELERELREYNLKSFINTGFSEKLTGETGVGM